MDIVLWRTLYNISSGYEAALYEAGTAGGNCEKGKYKNTKSQQEEQ